MSMADAVIRTGKRSGYTISGRMVLPRAGAEDRIRTALMALVCLWLLTGVLLPLTEVIRRATHVELPVSIEVPTEKERLEEGFLGQVNLGGRTVLLMRENGKPALYVDSQSVGLDRGEGGFKGVEAALEGECLREVRFDSVRSRDTVRRSLEVEPITVTRSRDGNWTLDGEAMAPEAGVRLVRRYIGLVNFFDYLGNPGMARAVWNSVRVAVWSTLLAVSLAFLYAYGINRTRMPGKLFFRVVAMLPLFAPTMLYGLSLVYLFGNKGLVTTGFFGRFPLLAADVGLYGFTGIVISEVVFTFPPAFMILLVALSNTDARLYEAAESLGAGPVRTFFTVTLPGIRYGLLSAVFVCFTLSFTDFGAPKVVGGQFNVLAVDIYKQVIGQQNFGMGATVSIILLIPTLMAFAADRFIQKRAVAGVTARSVPFSPGAGTGRDALFLGICGLIAGFLLAMVFTAGAASLVKTWP